MKKDLLNQTQEIEFIIFNASQINRYFPKPRAVPSQRECFFFVIELLFGLSKRIPPCFLDGEHCLKLEHPCIQWSKK